MMISISQTNDYGYWLLCILFGGAHELLGSVYLCLRVLEC